MRVQILNVCGLQGKAEEVLRFAHSNSTDICASFETWLSPTVSPPIRRPIANLTNTITHHIQGGHRHTGGILINALSPSYQASTRLVRTALGGNAAVIEVAGVSIIFTYLPPSLPDTCISELLELAGELTNNGARRCVIAGDLNARSEELSSDHTTNTRGRRLEEVLTDSEFRVQQPISGRWTSFSGGGFGIPDLVLANFPIRDLRVHEQESCGGSDHRPLTFTIHTQPPNSKLVDRWNIRRLSKPPVAKRYAQALWTDTQLQHITTQCQEALDAVNGGTLVGAALQARTDDLWAGIVGRVHRAAHHTVGRLQFQARTPRDFWTEALEQERDEVVAAQLAAQEAILSGAATGQQARAQHHQVATRMALYRANLRARGTTLFQTAVDNLGRPSNSAAFMRMVKGARKRQNGGGCALDPAKADTYVDHFKTTFGGQPTGNRYQPPEGEAPCLPGIEIPLRSVINPFQVERTIKNLPRGKAWGADDMPAEFFQAGIHALSGPLTAFLSLVFTGETVPTIWQLAQVVPIWKKKGSDKDIANYRPISLTCTGRRLYERLLLRDINRFVHQLADSQGGFRPLRGTPHQALSLHEALVTNPHARTAFLDLRAAYDLADRRRLWDLLAAKYRFPPRSIARLANLFDHNLSCLLVSGQKSKEIPNLRGVLQGSSLSPTLFNFLINDLAQQLEARQEGVVVHGRRLNCLLFADDTALVAATSVQLAALLEVCEKWSREAGMEFSPAKCICFAPTPPRRITPLRLYGVDLPSTEKAAYLGFPFTPLGINFSALCQERCEKARGVIAGLRSIGLNMTGWAPAASARIYKAFIRPVMEYGVELQIPTPSLLSVYQRTQDLALRTIFSAPNNTSIHAMHKLLGIQLFKDRCMELNFLSAHRFHNHNDASICGLDIWRRALEPRSEPARGSLPRHTMANNTLVEEYRNSFTNHATTPLTREDPIREPVPISDTARKQRRTEALQELGLEHNHVAASICVRNDGRPHHFLTAASKLPRATRVSITRWQLGLVAAHQACRACGAELSRQHGVECSGVVFETEQLETLVEPEERWGKTALDVLINAGAGEGFTVERAYLLVRAIDRIERRCRGRVRTAQGFWRPP